MELADSGHLEIGGLKVGYRTDLPGEYAEAVKGVESLPALRAAIEPFKPFAMDAWLIAQVMNEDEWPIFELFNKQARDNRRKQDPVLMEQYGAILVPSAMLKVSMVAQRFGAPWGCAAIRLAQAGRITEVLGEAVVNLGKMEEAVS